MEVNSYIICTTDVTHDAYSKEYRKILKVEGITSDEYEKRQIVSRITKSGSHAYVIPCMDVSPITHIGIKVNITNI